MRIPSSTSRLLCLLLSATTISPTHASSPPSPFTCPSTPPITSHCPAYNPPPPPPPPPSTPPPPPPPPPPASPWSRAPICRRVGHSEFCAFTHSTFASGAGISLITTPARILLLGSQPPLNLTVPDDVTPPPPPPPAYTAAPIPGKGLGLVATSLIRAGTRVMRATPAIMVDDVAFRGLRRGDLKVLLGQGVMGLPASGGREGFLGLSAAAGGEDGEDGVLDRVWRIFSTNAFRTTVKGVMPARKDGEEAGETTVLPEGWEKQVEFHSTFVEVSRLNHACSPNLGYYFDSATLSHRVYAVRDIFPGEELTISYVDVTQPSPKRQSLLSQTWSFTCTCPRCTAEPHVLAESDARCEHLNRLRRELDDYSASATPEKAELLVTLYELEGLEVRMYEAYYRAALEWNGVGDSGRAVRYARLCLDRGLLLRGPDRPFVESMRALVLDPTRHWSWRFRVQKKETEEGTGGQGDGKTQG
ncbi:SET domain-containing protein 5 [Podospora conica]|nr:SET domain-containing protein 5 [Schizothecium conicum]